MLFGTLCRRVSRRSRKFKPLLGGLEMNYPLQFFSTRFVADHNPLGLFPPYWCAASNKKKKPHPGNVQPQIHTTQRMPRQASTLEQHFTHPAPVLPTGTATVVT